LEKSMKGSLANSPRFRFTAPRLVGGFGMAVDVMSYASLWNLRVWRATGHLSLYLCARWSDKLGVGKLGVGKRKLRIGYGSDGFGRALLIVSGNRRRTP
jgi:hypothetical protein